MALIISGQKTTLKEVQPEDAADICALRNDEKISRFLSTSRKSTVEEQAEWIRMNKEKNDGYYFKVLDETGAFCGTASIYNLGSGEPDFGRFVCTRSLQAVETEYIAVKYAFESMGLDRIFCRTALDNKKVWKMHYNYGFQDVNEETIEFADKTLVIKNQELTRARFLETDYSFITNLLARF